MNAINALHLVLPLAEDRADQLRRSAVLAVPVVADPAVFARIADRAESATHAVTAARLALADHAAAPDLVQALRLAGDTIQGTLAERGYKEGSCTDGWTPAVRGEVATLAHIRATLAALERMP